MWQSLKHIPRGVFHRKHQNNDISQNLLQGYIKHIQASYPMRLGLFTTHVRV